MAYSRKRAYPVIQIHDGTPGIQYDWWIPIQRYVYADMRVLFVYLPDEFLNCDSQEWTMDIYGSGWKMKILRSNTYNIIFWSTGPTVHLSISLITFRKCQFVQHKTTKIRQVPQILSKMDKKRVPLELKGLRKGGHLKQK